MKLKQRFPRRPDLSHLQSAIISGLVEILVLLVLVVLVWAVIGVGLDVWDALTMRSVDAFKKLTIELLTVFIFIEIFHSLGAVRTLAVVYSPGERASDLADG